MHGESMSPDVAHGLFLYFFVLALPNVYLAVKRIAFEKRYLSGAVLAIVAMLFLGSAVEFYNGRGPVLSEVFRDQVDGFMGPVTYFVVSIAGFAAMIYFRRLFVTYGFGYILLIGSLAFIGYSMTDPDFRAIVAKPDNVPITMLIYSVGFTTWLALRQAVRNDDRIAHGQKPFEAEGSEKVLTWPDLVYTEMLVMVLCTVFLLVWSICLKAPLEPPASTTKIPNPSKAPWYFLGLQEMLVYFDPWLAGVVLPTYIIIGLCAMPYIDFNKKGNGYYTYLERRFAMLTFLFGFLVLWVTLIVLGTFLRGPNWNFFGFYEEWTPYKTEALNNINLSDWFWILVLNQALPTSILWRELPGILLILGYFFAIPPLLAKTVWREMFVKMGLIRFMVMTNVLLMMVFLPVKMVLRWVFNLKYLVYIPEYFFNI